LIVWLQFKENEAAEAQSIELRKMDPSAIYRMVMSHIVYRFRIC